MNPGPLKSSCAKMLASKTAQKIILQILCLIQVVPEPRGIADNLDEIAMMAKNFVDKNGVEQKVVELNDNDEEILDEEETMMAPSEADIERAKRLLRLKK